MPKIHNHSEQFDGAMHPVCGRGDTAVTSDEFEATPRAMRCAVCNRDWFPSGQPDWHFQGAVKRQEERLAAKKADEQVAETA